MFLRQTLECDEEATERLAVRICREVYKIGEKTGLSWLPIPPIAYDLDADFEDTFAALNYAVRRRWLNTRGNPANVMLLEPGRNMVARMQT